MARDAAELMPGRIGDSTLFPGGLEEMAAGIVAATTEIAAARRPITMSEAAFLRLEALALSEAAGDLVREPRLAGAYRKRCYG